MKVPDGDARADDTFDLELYKQLRQEATAYLEKIPAIWLQKFLFAGTVVAFIITQPVALHAFTSRSADFVIAGFTCVPLLALLLDVKIFEYSLHARAISRFIEIQFAQKPKIAEWEAALWGGGIERDVAQLTRYRSTATVAVTLASTAILILLSGIVVGSLAGYLATAVLCASSIAAIYIAVGVWAAIIIWPRLAATRREPAS